MFNRIILSLIQTPDSAQVKAMTADVYETPKAYKSWIYPIRYLLTLRYLKVKQRVLAWFRQNKIYPVPDTDYQQALVEALASNKRFNSKRNSPIAALSFKSKLIYPALISALIYTIFSLNSWYQDRKIENVLANYLPYYSDLLHRKLLLKHIGAPTALEKIEANIEKQQQKILSDLPEKNGIRSIVEQQLVKLKDSAVSSEDIMLGFKDVNTLFDKQGLPFYLTPKSFSMPCSSLIDAPVEEMMMIKKLEELMSNNNPERCRTTMMTVYRVLDRKGLYYDGQNDANNESKELPLFRVKRIDKVPAIDSALGLTFKDRGIGSIILIERIKNFARESVLPALTFQGRNYVIPYWMQGYYEIEEAITKGYKKDLMGIYPNRKDQRKVKTAIKKLIRDKYRMQNSKMQQTMQRTNSNSAKSIFGNGLDAISVLLGKSKADDKKKKNIKPETEEEKAYLKKLDDVLLPSIEYHEAYHQIDKKNWSTPAWVKRVFKDDISDQALDHTMEELGAYLAQLANTEQGHNIWLGKLLIFSLNPMTKGQAEYYASGLILSSLQSLYLGKAIAPTYIASVDEKNQIYKKLIEKDPAEIRYLATLAFQLLFQRDVPLLSK